jgi:hypothetical protein
MTPYEADPAKIPPEDTYTREPLYGRYLPKDDDIRPNVKYIRSKTPEALDYWASILRYCNPSIRLHESIEGRRDVFALGGMIIKSSHLNGLTNISVGRNFFYDDMNEVEAIRLMNESLPHIKVPEIYFNGKVKFNLKKSI